MTSARILIVEDELSIANDIKGCLKEIGYVAETVNQVKEEVFSKLTGERIDLVLIDLKPTGEKNTIELAETIQNRFKLPVIYLSSYADKETFERAKITEPYGYILKPFDDRKLEVAIELALYRHEMSQKLAESKERYVMTTSAGKIGVWDWNLETDEIYIDPSLKAILGYLDHEIRNHMDDWSRHVYPEDSDMVSAKASEHFEGKTPQFEVEHRMIHKDGSLRWFLARGKVMRNQAGKPYRMIGTDIDITERKEVEIALKKTLDFEKSLANCSQLLLESKNPDEAIKAILAELVSLMGVNLIHVFEIHKENSGKTFAKLISEELADGLEAHKDNPSLQHLSFDDNSSVILDKLAKGETYAGLVSKLPAAERKGLSSIGIVSILVVPIRIGEELWGAFVLGDPRKARTWKDKDLRYVMTISSMIANLIERNRAREETQSYMAELEEISGFSATLSRCKDVDEILELVGSRSFELSGGTFVIVTLADAYSDNIRIRKHYGLGKYVDAVLKTLQNDPREMVFSVNDMADDEKALFTSGKLSLMPGGLYNLTARRFPENVCKTLEKILRIEKIYTMGFTFGKKPFGGVNILMDKGAKLSHRFTLETIIREASFAIHRKRAEDERLKTAIELKDTSALLETVFDVFPDIIGVQDAERGIIRYNKAGYDFLNQTPEGVAGKKCFELINRDKPCEICATEIVYKTKKPAHVEKYFQELGIWLDCRAYPVLDDNGEVIRVVEHLRDITERKMAEKALRESEEQYRTTIDSMSDPVHVVDSDMRIILFNQAFAEWNKEIGLDTDAIGKTIFELFPFLPEKVGGEYRKVFQTGQKLQTEETTIVGENEFVTDTVKIPIFVEGKVKQVVTVIHDITERKKAENDLRESEERFRNLTETTSDWVWELDDNFRYTYVSPKISEVLGYQPEEVLGKTPYDFMPTEEAEKVKEAIEPAINLQAPFELFETIILHKDGHEVIMETSGVPYFDSEGRFKGYRGIDRDITECRQSEYLIRIQRDFAQELSTMTDLTATLKFCLDTALKGSGMDSGGIYLLDMDTGGLKLACHKGLSDKFIKKVSFFDKNAPNTKLALKGKPVYAPYEPEYADMMDNVRKAEGLRALSLIPITHEGEVIGCMNISSRTLDRIPGPARDTLETIAAQIGGVIARLRTVEALKSSENKYRTLFENAEDAIFIMEGDRFIDCNSRTLELYGCRREEIIGQFPYKFSPQTQPDGRGSKKKALEKINAAFEGKPQRFYWKHIKLDGTPFDAEVTLNRMDIGEKTVLQAIVRDISDRMRAEEALRSSEEKFAKAFHSSPNLMNLTDLADMRRLDVNEGFTRITGYSRDEAVGKTLDEFNIFVDPREVKKGLRLVRERAKGETFDARIRTKSGEERILRYSGDSFEAGGRELAIFVGVDITERKKAAEALRNSEREKAAILGSMKEHVIYHSPDFRILWANKAAADSLGMEPEELVGKRCYQLWPKQNEICEDCPVLKARETGDMHEVEQTTPDGRIWFVRGYPVKDEEGNVVAMVETTLEITERKRAEEALKTSMRRNEALLQAMPDMMFVMTRDGTYIDFQADRDEHLAIPRDQIIGKNITKTGFSTETVNSIKDSIAKALKTKETQTIEYELMTPIGLGFYEARIVPLTGSEVLATVRDVTERVIQSKQIEQAKQEWERTFDATSDLIMIVDKNRRIVRANLAVAEYAGLDMRNLLGKAFFEVFHLPAEDENSCTEDVCVESGKTQHTELTDPVTGKVFLMSVSPLFDDEGQTLGTVDVARDITKIRTIEAALMQSEAQFRGLAESVEDIIFSIDNEGRFKYLNPAVNEILGFKPKELAGKEVTKSPLEDFIVWDAINKDMFPGREQIPLFETEVKDSDGRKRILEVSARRLPRQIVGVARDITERKLMEQQLIKASKLASIGVLASGIAHQVNNPLAIMVLSATAIRDLLTQETIESEELRNKITKYINTLDRQIHRTRKVVSGLLSFTQEKQAKIAPADLKDILADSTQFISQHPSNKTLALNVSHATDLPKVLVDPVALGQVIVNIIQNAIDAMKGEGEISIQTEKSNTDYARILITDTGPGIPKQLKEDIFEPLFSTKTADRGTGLGLPLSVMLLERFGGRIYLEDKSPPGATFVIEVPIAKEEMNESQKEGR